VTITTLSSREFNQDASKAKKAAKAGPVTRNIANFAPTGVPILNPWTSRGG
jgi:hypothetical protein